MSADIVTYDALDARLSAETAYGMRGCWIGDGLWRALLELPDWRDRSEIVLSPDWFGHFVSGLTQSLVGTIYPFQDGGILWTGPTRQVLVKPGYPE